MVFACKKCKKIFRKNIEEYEEADEYCPHCDNHYVIEAKTREQCGKMVITMKMEKGHEHKMVKDDREKERDLVLQKDLEWNDDESDEDFHVDNNIMANCCKKGTC